MEISQNTTLPPEYQGLTFEKVWAAIQENGRQMKEQRQETEVSEQLYYPAVGG